VQLSGLRRSELEQEQYAPCIGHILRLEPEEWLAISYRHVKGPERFAQRSFHGHIVRADQFNYRRPRICPHCLHEQSVWWAIWDLAFVAVCPRHRCLLINQCPTCGRNFAWHRPAVDRCRCRTDLRALTTEVANTDLVAINTVIHRAAGFPSGPAAELELNNYHFPPELARLALGSLLRLIRFLGLIGEENRLRRKQRTFHRTDPVAAIHAGQASVAVLRDWPQPLREMLKGTLPEDANNPAELRFHDIFGNFYRHLFRVLPRSEFGFLHEVFESFVVEDWRGLVRGQHRFLSAATRRNSQWMPAEEAERAARVHSKRIVALVRQGQIEGLFSKVPRGRARCECWIKRESLNRWIASRDVEFVRYMARPEAKRALGLTNCTIVKVAKAGLIRYIEGPGQNFPTGCFFFLREDVMKIKHAFEKYVEPAREYSKPGELIALRHALKNYLGRDSGLPAVIQAVIEGALVPIGCTKNFSGITGYLFLSEHLRKYRPVSDVKVPPEGFLNYREAASMLGTRTEVIRALVAQGVLTSPTEYRPGLSKLVPAGDLQRFGEQYITATVLAKRLHLDHRSAVYYLKKSGTPMLSISVPGKGQTRFLRKEIAAHLRIPAAKAR